MAVSHVLAQEPYCHINRELAITLQGRIYLGSSTIIQKRTAVKEAWRGLVHSKCAQNGCIVYESFLNERRTIMILSQMPDCKGVITGLDQWEDSNCYYLAMEHCEAEFYNYINRYHLTLERERFVEEQTLKKQIPASEPTLWIRTCSLFFRQICEAVKWMHSKGYCHLDLSLENTMISDLSSLKIKLIDFGLARYFPDGNFECDRQDKRIGKTNYMAPEIYDYKPFNAQKADIWTLGTMLYMMLLGNDPYKKVHDVKFRYIINGSLEALLVHSKDIRLVTADALDLMNKILCYEKDRISMDEILRHPFLNVGSSQMHSCDVAKAQIYLFQEAGARPNPIKRQKLEAKDT